MEKGITRFVALLCATGGLGLAWAFGMFMAVPLRDGRLFSISGTELHLLLVSFFGTLLVIWGASHLLALADKEDNPLALRLMRIILGVAVLAAAGAGANWSMMHVVS